MDEITMSTQDYTEPVQNSQCEQAENLPNDIMMLGGTEMIEIRGTAEQVQEMFEDWSAYIGEVENPLKTATNYNKGNYAPLNEVLDGTRPILAKYGFGIMQVPTTNGNKVSISTILTYRNGACISFPALIMNAAKDDPQTIIATVTYGRRAILNAILAVYGENDDDGNAASVAKKTKAKKVPTELEKARHNVVELCQKKVKEGVDKETMYNIIKVNNNGNRQPNAITDVETCEKVIAEINKLKSKEND